ncbi:deoxycytidylate deaminase [Thermus phage phiYS40]|uniref:deoxycytidylate deaminase n=1 Tax=Thermus phage phiYS40 TaxID=407392 RepID=UPI0000E6899C|nr:deoxycytidylate deaminase [Thermus phage phiYS40]ABJ91432.1 deoxycytidylate deaminase [Thermus phage phiYS40]BAK53556.1 deoxycytidylate deaminase [Thermus phage phiYS40]
MDKWHKRFIELAKTIAQYSKDPRTKVGAVIVDNERRIVSMGYNGFPRKVLDLEERLNNRKEKLKYVVHAELNAILNAKRDIEGTTIYVYPYFPCNECAKAIIQSGIKKVITTGIVDDNWKESVEASKNMFNEAGIIVEIFQE